MAERLHHIPESENTHEAKPYGSAEHLKKSEEDRPTHSPEKEAEKLKILTEKIEKEAKSSKEFESKIDKTEKQAHGHHQSTQYQAHTGSQAIKRVQKHLKPSERKFSKVVHNPAVEIISDITGGTVARPSGLLYGGLFSLLSSLALYFISKHYGYEYSYFVGILFFVGGFVFGLLVESTLKIFKKNS